MRICSGNIKNRILIFLLITALLACFVSCGEDENPRLREYELKRAALTLEKQGYIDEQYKLREGVESYAGNSSFMSFIVISMDCGFYDDLLPLFNDTEVPLRGVMALSEDELPGQEGNITVEQYAEIAALGWETTVYWPGPAEASEGETVNAAESLDSYLSSMETHFSRLGAEWPRSVVFGCEISSDEYESVLTSHCIESVLRDDTVNQSIVSKDYPEGIWYSGVLGWRDLYRSTRIKNKVEQEGGYASFMISLDNSEGNYNVSFYALEGESTVGGTRHDSFNRMLLKYREAISAGRIEVLGIAEARTRMRNYYDSKDIYLVESAERIKELDLMIDDVERRLIELYREYYPEYNSTGGH